jgi:glycosyltransferase involved in cell wall biosynthesis
MESIDVVMLTLNSFTPILPRAVDSLYANVPVRRLIVVDNGSTDGTLEFLGRYPNVSVVDNRGGTRASSRQRGIEAVESEWFMFLDSDIVLCEGWYSKASGHITPKVGAVFGATIPMDRHVFNAVNAIARLKRTSVVVLQASQKRYLTGDTLFRKKAVEGIRIPPDLQTLEDEYIGKYLVSRGYQFLRVSDAYCHHYISQPGYLNEAVYAGYMMRKYRLKTFSGVLASFATAIPLSLWVLAYTRDFVAFRRQLLGQTLPLMGWFSAE